MNEHPQEPMSRQQLEGLFKQYSDSLGEPSRTPYPRPRRSKLPAYAAVFVVLALALVALWPRDALAARLKQIGLAIKDAKTMEMTFSRLQPSGRWVQWLHTYYTEGMWRQEIEKGVGQRETVVTRNGLMLSDYHRLDHATLGPVWKEEGQADFEQQSALDYALDRYGQSASDETVTRSTQGHSDVNGRAAYAIVVDRSGDTPGPWSDHMEIVVDKQTNYPISADIRDVRPGENGGEFKMHQDYRFNMPLDPALFELKSDKPIVDLRESPGRLAKEWAHPLAELGPTQIRDASVTRDGTIWIAYTTNSDDESAAAPTEISIEGARYVSLGAFTGPVGEAAIHLQGQEVEVVGFAPLEVPAKPPFVAVVRFQPESSLNVPPENPPAPFMGAVPLNLTLVAGEYPPYFPLLGYDRAILEVQIATWGARAKGLVDAGRYLDAAHAYERTAKECENFVKYIGYRDLDKAAECYDKLGMAAEAARDRALADALHAARER
ncbi:MAG TPA: hypothetical protein VMI31_17605 [Fimbriimonadaceae bacterium]|nr:hypothetical protein [Fimbriimonadaceae bacterium]